MDNHKRRRHVKKAGVPPEDSKKKTPPRRYNLRKRQPREEVEWVDEETEGSTSDSTYEEEESGSEGEEQEIHGIKVPANVPVSVKIHLHARVDEEDDEDYEGDDDDTDSEDDDDDYEEEDSEEDEEESLDEFLTHLLSKYGGGGKRGRQDQSIILITDEGGSGMKKSGSVDSLLKLSKEERDYFEKLPKKQQKKTNDKMKAIARLLKDGEVPSKFRVIDLPIPDATKAAIIKKIDTLKKMGFDSGESHKLRTWVDAFLRIPFGKQIPLPVTMKDGQEKCAGFLTDAQQTLDAAVYGMQPVKTQVMQILAQWIANPGAVGNVIALRGPAGVGKCHAKDTPILMYDGMTKLVQDIQVGDQIMGDDSTPRTVLSLGSGEDDMYDIIPTKGESYRVNSEHILCLKQSGVGSIRTVTRQNGVAFKTVRFNPSSRKLEYKTFADYDDASAYLATFSEEDNITEISVKDYLQLPNEIRKVWLKGYRKGVEFSPQDVDFDPYILGLWLGDGTSSATQITSQDSVVIGYLNKKLREYDLMLTYRSQYDYYIGSFNKKTNYMMDILRKYNLLNNKHIPDIYLRNSREVRLATLAGLLDSDGYLIHNCFEITQKSDALAKDILYLARSLGFAAYAKKCETSCSYKNEIRTGVYNRIFISGDISQIPTKIERKKAEPRSQIKDVLVTAIDVQPAGRGTYYGFTLDSNHRYLMGDFTVTHNTSIARNGIAAALKRPFSFFSLGGASDISHFVGHSYTYEGSIWGRIIDSLMTAGCMNPVFYFDELDKISTTPHGEEITAMLIHLTDRSQNMQYHDRYFAGVDFDLSQCLFVFSFNDENKVHPILKDRMQVIHCSGYNEKEKKVILTQYVWPTLLERLSFQASELILTDEAINFLIQEHSQQEEGVRTLIRVVENVVTRLNLLRIAGKQEDVSRRLKFAMDISFPLTITREVVEKLLSDITASTTSKDLPFGMYT